MKREDKDWIESSGNVFEDMGIEKHAAEILGVPRPRINRLLH